MLLSSALKHHILGLQAGNAPFSTRKQADFHIVAGKERTVAI
jgi:hypothetical protein